MESGGKEERGSLGLGVRAWERASERPALPVAALGATSLGGSGSHGDPRERETLSK